MDGEPKDNICGEVDDETKRKIAHILGECREPIVFKTNRYDDWEERTDALDVAINKLNEMIGYPVVNKVATDFGNMDMATVISEVFAPFLFDLIELQYVEFSDNEKDAFHDEINVVFRDNDVPWIIANGVMIKIDSKQFEQDLKRKALERLHELTDSAPVFQ